MEEQEGNLKDQVKELHGKFDKLLASGKVKGFKPNKKLSNADVKKNFIFGIVVDDNREIKFMKLPVSEGTTVYDGIPRMASPDYMLTYKGKPAMIIPSWSVKPFSPADNYSDTVKEKMSSAGYKLLLNKIEQGQLKVKKSLPGWMIFAIVIGVIVAGYLIFKGFK